MALISPSPLTAISVVRLDSQMLPDALSDGKMAFVYLSTGGQPINEVKARFEKVAEQIAPQTAHFISMFGIHDPIRGVSLHTQDSWMRNVNALPAILCVDKGGCGVLCQGANMPKTPEGLADMISKALAPSGPASGPTG